MPREILRVDSLAGGRNTFGFRESINENESPDDLNVIAEEPGSIQRRKGFVQWVNMVWPDSTETMSLARFIKSDGTRWLMVMTGSQLWGCRGDYPYENYVLAYQGAASTDGYVSFAQMGDWLFMTDPDGNGPGLRWDGVVGATSAALSLNPYFDYVPAITPSFASGSGSVVTVNATNPDYVYRLRLVFGDLGEMASHFRQFNYDVAADSTTGTITLTGFSAVIAANAALGATSVKIYRSRHDPVAIYGANATPIFYLVGETSTNTFDDTLNDEDLVDVYPVRTNPTNGQYLAVHRDRMWRAYDSTLQWSPIFEPAVVEDETLIDPSDGSFITGLVPMSNFLLIFKEGKIYGMYGNDPRDFEVAPFESAIGCIAPRTIANSPDGVYFLSSDGLRIFTGSQQTKLSTPIDPDLRSIPRERLREAAGAYHRGRYYLSIPLS